MGRQESMNVITKKTTWTHLIAKAIEDNTVGLVKNNMLHLGQENVSGVQQRQQTAWVSVYDFHTCSELAPLPAQLLSSDEQGGAQMQLVGQRLPNRVGLAKNHRGNKDDK